MELEKPLDSTGMSTETPSELPNATINNPSGDNELSPVIVIPRVTFNYAVIAMTFLLVGVVVGTLLTNRSAQSTQELISEAVAAALEAQGVTGAVSTGPSLDNPNSRFTVTADDDPALGPEDAKVTIIEFGDFNCQYCRRFAQDTLEPLLAQYKDRVRFVYRDYPILADSSVTAALAAECLKEQDKFWEFHDLVYSDQIVLDENMLVTLADEVGANAEEFSSCLAEQRYFTEVRADYLAGQQLGIRGTPMFFINGRPVSGAQQMQVFIDIIEEELAAAEQATEEPPTEADTGA